MTATQSPNGPETKFLEPLALELPQRLPRPIRPFRRIVQGLVQHRVIDVRALLASPASNDRPLDPGRPAIAQRNKLGLHPLMEDEGQAHAARHGRERAGRLVSRLRMIRRIDRALDHLLRQAHAKVGQTPQVRETPSGFGDGGILEVRGYGVGG